MHELSIALSIVELATEEAERRGGAQVAAVHLKLGQLSGVIKDALLSAYELAREGSALAQSRLVIEETPVIVFCSACRAERPVVSTQELCCQICGSPSAEVVSGRQLELVALEVLE